MIQSPQAKAEKELMVKAAQNLWILLDQMFWKLSERRLLRENIELTQRMINNLSFS